MAGIQPQGPVRGAPTDPSVPDSARSGAEPGAGASAGTGAGIGSGSWRRGQRPGQTTGAQPSGAQPAGEGVVAAAGDQGVAAGPDGRPAGARGWVLTNSTGVLVAVSLLLVGLVAAVASTISWQVNASSAQPAANVSDSPSSSPAARVPVVGGLASATPTPTPKPSAAKTTAAPEPTTAQPTPPPAAAAEPPSPTPSASKAPLAQTFTGAGDVLLQNFGTGMCVDVPGNGAGQNSGRLQQHECLPGSGDNQMWTLNVISSAEGPDGARLFSVSNDKDGLCMDLPSNGPQASGTAVTEFTCNATTTDNQLWYLDAADNTHYLLRNLASDAMCLGVKGGISGASDALLLIEPCQSTADEWAMATG